MKTFEPKYDKSGIPHYGREKPHEGPEYKFQEASARLLAYHKAIVGVHVPNERSGKVNKFTMFSLMRQGVVPGLTDWIFFTPETGFVELKCEGGKLNDNQKEFLLRMKDKGFKIAVVWNLDAFDYVCKAFLNGSLP